MHNFISVLAITMFGKSDLSIRVADKIDKLDRTWELFANSLIRISIRKVRFVSGRFRDERVRFMARMLRRFFYYLVILASSFLLTRDDLTHDWFIDWRDTNMEVIEFGKHKMEYISFISNYDYLILKYVLFKRCLSPIDALKIFMF